MQFNLRDYRAADFERLWEIDQFCFPPGISYTQMELNGFITRRNAITVVADFCEAQPGQESAETAARAIAGFIIAHPVRGKSGRILTLDIVPSARRLGLASLLMQQCECRLRSFGCKETYLETAVNNEPALKLYRKLGYQILRTLPGYYSNTLDAFLMGKLL